MANEILIGGRAAESALAQNRVLRNTYWMLGLTMIPTVIGALVGVNTSFAWMKNYPVMGPLLMLAVMMGIMFGVSALRNSVWGVALLLGFTFVMGWWLGPILQVALNLRNGAQLVAMAAGATGAVFFTLATIATVTKKDFRFLGNFLFVGLILLVLASVANLFFMVPALALTISAAGALLFSAYILYDVSDIVQGGETNYVMGTLRIYLDIYNLFVSLLNLLMAFGGQRD